MGINEVILLEMGILISISKSSKKVTLWNSHLNFSRYHFTLKARFHYERGKEHSLSLLLIFD